MTTLGYAILGLLAREALSGYDVTQRMKGRVGFFWGAGHSQIYPELARLRDDGLIEQTGAGARNSKTYAVTDAGLAQIRHWLRDTEPDRRVRSDAALRTFFLWLLEPEEARDEVERERIYWRERLAELEAIEARPRGPGRKEQAFGIALEGGIRGIRTRLEWLDWAGRELGTNPE